jgi:hypothetical protein
MSDIIDYHYIPGAVDTSMTMTASKAAPWKRNQGSWLKPLWVPGPSGSHLLICKTGGLGPVAQTCNPSYLGGSDQEDQDLKPAQT